jgi:hypothetical protein
MATVPSRLPQAKKRNRERERARAKEYSQANKERIKARVIAYRERNRDYIRVRDWFRREFNRVMKPELREQSYRKHHLKRNYGLTEDDYTGLLLKQDGACAICRTKKPGNKRCKYFFVDHCHDSGKVRGLLCYECNSALGFAQDSTVRLGAMIEYLHKAQDPLATPSGSAETGSGTDTTSQCRRRV